MTEPTEIATGLIVSVLDDRPLALEAIARLLEGCEEIGRVDRVLSSVDGLRNALAEPYDCLVLRAGRPPSGDSETLLRAVRRLRPEVGAILLLDGPDPDQTARAIRAGARGIVTLRSTADDLWEAVRVVARGGTYLPGSLFDDTVRYLHQRADEASLAPRARAALALASQGLTTPEIADRLSCGATTVKRLLREAIRHLGARTRAEAVYLARQRGLVDEQGPSV